MKRNVIAKRMATAMLTGVMAMSMGMNVFAAVESIPVTKKVTTDGNTYAPNTTFEFQVTPGTGEIASPENAVVYAGVADGLAIEGTAVFSPNREEDTASEYTNGTVKLKVNASVFTNPGVYHYLVSETIPESGYEGIVYDESEKNILVYVERNASNEMEVMAVIEVDENGEKVGTGSDGIEFVNNYGYVDPENPDTNDDTTHDITVTKQVTGNQGDLTKEFKFDVSVTPGTSGEIYKVVKISDGEETLVDALPLADGTSSMEVSLKSGESVKIYGLSRSDEYSITEKEANTDGYTTSVEEGGTNINAAQTGSEGALTADGSRATVVNDRNITAPTGIILSFVPYILMIAAAGVFAVMFLRKKREEF